jgi:tetratricopeptide (TPR) repeat protein
MQAGRLRGRTTLQDAIERIAVAVRNASYRKEKCTLLIGAGCSITAGIKSAPGIVADIRDSRGKTDGTDLSFYYDRALERAKQRDDKLVQPTYGDCMSVLPPGPQRDLLRGYIDRAKLNWAHVGIGALVHEGYVDRILTTNFDPLIARGCAVFHEFPAVYDLTMSPKLKLEDLADKAVFHLHGQRNGFSLLNSDEELREHKQHVKPLFDHARSNRTWIVCGYSGENDPLMDFIVEQDRYDYELFWIDIKDAPPARLHSLTERREQTFCRYFRFPGADQFFIRLAKQLGLFPFRFMDRPIEHMQALVGNFAEFPLDATDLGLDLLKDARERLDHYQSLIADTDKSAYQAAAEQIAGVGVAKSQNTSTPSTGSAALSSTMRATIAFMAGYEAHELAKSAKLPHSALVGFREAARHYAEAVALKPDNHRALNNWGITLAELAQRSPDDEACRLWAEAGEKYAAALEIKSDMHEALLNWGIALDELAQRSPDDEARRFLAEAGDKYAAALAIKPDMNEALYNWSNALIHSAHRNSGATRQQLLAEAYEKVSRVEALVPGQGAYNLACIHAMRGELDDMTHWLDRSHAAGKLPTREHIAADKDFDNVRETPQFKAWLAKMGWLG